MISAATLSVWLALHVRKVKKRKNLFSVKSQNLLYTIFCEFTVYHWGPDEGILPAQCIGVFFVMSSCIMTLAPCVMRVSQQSAWPLIAAR